MTRQEAIEILTESDYFWLRPSENEAKALNIAIEALEQLSFCDFDDGEPLDEMESDTK